METKAYRIVSEWDIGEEDRIYASRGLAEKSLDNNLNIPQLCRECDADGWGTLRDEGFITIREITFVTE